MTRQQTGVAVISNRQLDAFTRDTEVKQSIQTMKRIEHRATFSLMVSLFMFDEKVSWIKAAPYAHV